MALLDAKLPKYKCALPVSKKEVEFRPFTVKEEKILLLAQEDNTTERILQAIDQIISNCTFDNCSIDNINKIDAEYLFIQLRNKSMGEGLPIKAYCKSCDEKTSMTLNLEDITVSNPDFKSEPIEIMDGVWFTLKIPTIHESFKIIDGDSVTALAIMLESVIEGESVKEATDYTMEERIETIQSLSKLQLSKLKTFFDNVPVLTLDVDFTCKCGTENKIHIEGIESFFV